MNFSYLVLDFILFYVKPLKIKGEMHFGEFCNDL